MCSLEESETQNKWLLGNGAILVYDKPIAGKSATISKLKLMGYSFVRERLQSHKTVLRGPDKVLGAKTESGPCKAKCLTFCTISPVFQAPSFEIINIFLENLGFSFFGFMSLALVIWNAWEQFFIPFHFNRYLLNEHMNRNWKHPDFSLLSFVISLITWVPISRLQPQWHDFIHHLWLWDLLIMLIKITALALLLLKNRLNSQDNVPKKYWYDFIGPTKIAEKAFFFDFILQRKRWGCGFRDRNGTWIFCV